MEIQGNVRSMMAKVIIDEYKPLYLSIADESQEYTNYRNEMYLPSKETHFTIYIKSTKFDGMPIFKRVNEVRELLKFAYEISVFHILIFCYDSNEYTVWMNENLY